jgi:uncharacterized Rmd1/YagE family protein
MDELQPIQIPGSIPFRNNPLESPQPSTPLTRIDSIDQDGTVEWDEFHTSNPDPSSSIVATSEIFVFDFGVAVFWGVQRNEEKTLLEIFRSFAVKGLVHPLEFTKVEDDMAFVTSPVAETITISNDVVTIPDGCSPKQRLAVSFAIAQSTMLAIFEARIERKIEEYKYIPEVCIFSLTDLQIT